MPTAKVIREFYAIRFSHAEFGARPDLTHPELVQHPLSEGRYVVTEFDNMTEAYIAAHAAMGTVIQNGPLKGRSMAGSGVDVIRVAEHDPMAPDLSKEEALILGDDLAPVTMTITGTDTIPAIPHFATGKLSRYSPVNGWVIPETVEV